MTIENTLAVLADGWQNRNVEQVVQCFSPDGVYFSSVGCLPGEKAEGRRNIRKLVADMFEHDAIGEAEVRDIHIHNDKASWIWVYRKQDGTCEFGCDLFVFSDDLILLKDAYRKIDGPLSSQ